MAVPKIHLNNSKHMLIPVTAKLIHSTVYTCKRFLLRDGRLLHMVELIGAVRNYCHGYMLNIIIDVEDGIELVQVIVWHKQNYAWQCQH